MIRKFHPSGFGFWGGLGLGLLIALFAFGDLARMLTLVAPAEAQFAPVFRLMDGAHTQLATVDHTGALSVSLSGSSGGGISVTHIQSATHISGRVMLQNVAGTAVTVTGTALDVNCTGCAAASVVAVSHISGAVHVVNSFGQALHIQGLGVPGGSHGGVLTIQGITGGNPVATRLVGAPNVALGVLTSHAGALNVTCQTAAGVAESCGGSGGGDAVNVFHQSTVRHISSVTHVAGGVSLVNQAGTYVTVTGTALDVSCTGCSSSATVHVSAALHVAGTIQGARFHIQGVGSPGQSHGGVVTIQGVTGMNALVVNQGTNNWTIAHITGAVHLAGSVTDQNNSALRVTGVTVFTVMGAIDHISGTLHLAGSINGARIHVQGVGTPGQAHGGVMSVQGVGGGIPLNVENVRHVSSALHVSGRIMLSNIAGTAVTVTGTALDVNCTGCAAASVVNVAHISAAVHVVNSFGQALHIQGLGTPGSSHGGVLSVQGINGGNAVAVSQSGTWNIGHIAAAVHLAGGVTDQNNSALRVTGVTVFTIMGAVDHISSVTHVRGGVFLTNQAGAAVTTTSNALDVNCTGCSSSATVHISAALHIAGTIQGARLHIQGVGSPGQSHGGVLTIQGVTGMNAVAVSQSTAIWTVAHITSVTHVYGTLSLVSRAGVYASFTGTTLDVNCATGCSSGGTISHITSVVHVVGYAGAALHMQGIGLPGAAHGGVVSIQGVGGMVAVSVSQSIAAWNIAHVTSVTHVYGRVSLVGRDGTYITFTGTALDVNCSAGCAAGTPIPHISGSLHIGGTIKGAQFHVTGLGLPGQTHGGVFTVQGVTGMIGMAVYQDTPRWTVAHVTSVTHVYGSVSLVGRDGTYAGFAGTSILVASSSGQSGSWTIQAAHQGGEWNVRHVSAVVHVSIVSSGHLTGAIHVVGISNIGSGAPGTYTTQMVCHSTLAIHVAAAAPGLTQIIHLTSTNGNVDQTSWRIYICGIMVVSAHAQGFSLFEGTGTTCSTLKRSLIGAYRPDDSVVLAASGGFSAIAPFPWMSTQVAGNNLCIGQTTRTAGGTISGVISYRAGP